MWEIHNRFSDVGDTNVILECDITGEKLVIDRSNMPHETHAWITAARKEGWTVIVENPIPWTGIALSSTATKDIENELSGILDKMYQVVRKHNGISLKNIMLSWCRSEVEKVMKKDIEKNPEQYYSQTKEEK